MIGQAAQCPDHQFYFLSPRHTCIGVRQVSLCLQKWSSAHWTELWKARGGSCCLTSNQLAVSGRIRGSSWSAVNGIRADQGIRMKRCSSPTFTPPHFTTQENISVRSQKLSPSDLFDANIWLWFDSRSLCPPSSMDFPDLQVSIMGLKPGYAADTHSAALFWNGLKL